MKNKGCYIGIMIRTFIILIFLLVIMMKNQNMIAKIMVFPFILCSLFSIGKNICLMCNKQKIAIIFGKLFFLSFLAFWFGLLIYGSYLFIKMKNYFSIIMTIPFWLVGIYITCKYFLGIKPKKVCTQKKSKIHFQMIVSSFLVFIVLAIGIICLYFGICDIYRLNQKTKGYVVTDGYYQDYEIYYIDEEGKTTYQLNYTYQIEGKEYRVSTEYGVGKNTIPKVGSIRKVRYNPNNYSEAILVGLNRSIYLIYFGAFFTLVGSVFVFITLQINGVFDKLKYNIVGTYIGMVCIIIGVGIILFQTGITSSLIEIIQMMKMWILVPILFIISGIYLTLKSLFFYQKH